MSTSKQYNKLRLLKETRDAYKSILIAEGFMDLLVDLVFGRQITAAGNSLAKDPEYIKNIKKLKQLDQELVKLQQNYNQHKNSRIEDVFIRYGVDLYDLDEGDRTKELYALARGLGKYKNLKPLSKQQQEFNRKIVSNKR